MGPRNAVNVERVKQTEGHLISLSANLLRTLAWLGLVCRLSMFNLIWMSPFTWPPRIPKFSLINAVTLRSVRVSVLVLYLQIFVLVASLVVAAVSPLPNVDYFSHLEAEWRSPDAYRSSLHYALVRFYVCRPVTGTQQTSWQGESCVNRGKISLLSIFSVWKQEAEIVSWGTVIFH
jgi:hypothetical protein